MSAKSIAKANWLTMEVADDQRWKKVEKFIERWMKAQKVDITVTIKTLGASPDFKRSAQTFDIQTSKTLFYQLLNQHMAKLTIRKSGRVKKPSKNTRTCSESPSVAKPSKKRAKKAKFIDPNNIDTVEDTEEDEDAPAAEVVPAPLEDISKVSFTIMKLCTFGGVAVLEDCDFCTLEEFDFRYFNQQAMRKVDKAAQDAKCEFEWVSGQAIITQQATKVCDYLPITVEDESGWKKVEMGVTRWMREKKKPITVKLTITYKKKGETNAIDSDNEIVEIKKVYLN